MGSLQAASPCGAVHTRHKKETGRRAALASLAVTYGRAVPWRGPLPTAVSASAGAVNPQLNHSGALVFAAVPNQTQAGHT